MEIIRDKAIFIIAEVGQAHDGKFTLAEEYIKKIATTGVDAIKFQTHIAEAESTLKEPFRVKSLLIKDKTRYDYWKRMQFSKQEWLQLKKKADSLGLVFMSSPFSLEAVSLLHDIGMKVWKIGSGEFFTRPLLEAVVKTEKPLIISTGMSSVRDIDEIVSFLKRKKADFTLLQNTTLYPCPFEKIGLNVMTELKSRYKCAVGLSDHSGTIYPSLAAATLGASVVEVHVIFDRNEQGLDAAASVTIDELKEMVRGIRCVEKMVTHSVNKDTIAKELSPLKKVFAKSIVAKHDLSIGTVLTMENIAFKKPGTGILSEHFKKVLGKRLRKAVLQDYFFKKEDLL